MKQLIKFKKIISVILVLTMVVCFAAGCNESEEYYSYYEIIEDEDDGDTMADVLRQIQM